MCHRRACPALTCSLMRAPDVARGMGSYRHGSSKAYVLLTGMTLELSPTLLGQLGKQDGWGFDLSMLKQGGFQRAGAVGNTLWVWAACKSLLARERLVREKIRNSGGRR